MRNLVLIDMFNHLITSLRLLLLNQHWDTCSTEDVLRFRPEVPQPWSKLHAEASLQLKTYTNSNAENHLILSSQLDPVSRGFAFKI